MVSDSRDGEQGIVIALIGVIVVMVLVMAVGIGLGHGTRSGTAHRPASAAAQPVQPVQPTASDALPAGATSAQLPAALSPSEAATLTVESGVVKFYFASNKAELAPGSAAALDDLIAGVRKGGKLLISGFHDPSGDQARNIELARQRALAVRSILREAGVTDAQIELKKPEQMLGSGSAEEARRVEVTLVAVSRD